MQRRLHGFTLLELVVVIGLVIILFATALENLLPLRGAAERAALASTIGSLRSAVGVEAAKRAIRGGNSALLEMNGANPMTWFADPPSAYVGEHQEPDAVPAGHWAWLPEERVLYYRLRYPQYVAGETRGVRLRVRVERGANGQAKSIALEQLDMIEWNLSGSELKRWLEMNP